MARPETEQDLAEVVRAATEPLRIVGGGTRGMGGAGTPLETGGLAGIELYEPGALTLVVRAGTPVAEVETALAAEGQRLAFEPMDHRGLIGGGGTPTIGGVCAGNISGPRRINAGACRDFMLGVRFVDGTGQVIKNGGRVMKNVTGYDLVKLMGGSYGTLGVLTEVALKVLPAPAETAVLRLRGLSDADAVRALSAGLTSPFEVTGAAHAPQGPGGEPETWLRIEGFAEQMSYRTGKLQGVLAPFGEVEILRDPEETASIWRWVRDVAPFHDTAGDVWRISCKPTEGPQIASRLDAAGLLYDWGGGLIWALLPEGADARARLGDFGGHATLVRGSGQRFHPEPAPIAALTAGLRAKFDPKGIFNPGLMG
ncbi:glycolate oxidase FAD binding subunit [Poseidonocella pacifica]|uniref:Glycolate oxidase FAD binding subunit n=1 Tax=Poseidonocella pacifica TaxID=871651 RepID=A0A1I0WC11_9RHOB|nr:FAD-binding protein [Poseidonocella pacifica]SFA86259.1 glycolate oxidase FAD binding subunit [Poseidonocella pacifica]